MTVLVVPTPPLTSPSPPSPDVDDQLVLDPPTYSPSAAVPPYSPSPRPSERLLEATARTRRSRPRGIFVRSNALITIALRGQEEDAVLPAYGRNHTVSGDIGLSCTQGVYSVSIKVKPFSLLVLALISYFNWFLFGPSGGRSFTSGLS
jgi:hypothetical protein